MRKLPIPEPIALGLGILVASVISLAALAFLIRGPIQHEGLFLFLCAAAFLLPVAVVLWVLYPESLRRVIEPPVHTERPPNDASWLEIDGDDEQGYTFTGDQAALRRIGAECLRLAEEGADGDEASVELAGLGVAIRRRNARPEPPPQTWRDRAAGWGCLLFLLLAFVSLIRGCVALRHDVQRWVQ